MWLNEGFATYKQYLGSNHVQKNDTGVMDWFVIGEVQNSLERGKHFMRFEIIMLVQDQHKDKMVTTKTTPL